MKKNLVKKMLVLALAGTMTVSMAACGGTTSSSQTTTSSKAESSKTESSKVESVSSKAESTVTDSSAASSTVSAADSSAVSSTVSAADSSAVESVDSGVEHLAGGWTAVVTEEDEAAAKKALENATETLAGVNYEFGGLLGKQLVAGMNYLVVARATPVVPDARPTIDALTVYENLDGNAEITGTWAMYNMEGDAMVANDGALSLDDEENAELKAIFDAKFAELEDADKIVPVAIQTKTVRDSDAHYIIICRYGEDSLVSLMFDVPSEGEATLHAGAVDKVSSLVEAVSRNSEEDSSVPSTENEAESTAE